jgi:hypothetical protein
MSFSISISRVPWGELYYTRMININTQTRESLRKLVWNLPFMERVKSVRPESSKGFVLAAKIVLARVTLTKSPCNRQNNRSPSNNNSKLINFFVFYAFAVVVRVVRSLRLCTSLCIINSNLFFLLGEWPRFTGV